MTESQKTLKDIFEKRRSVNFFDDQKEIPDDLLKKIINLAVLAPSSFNTQPWRLIAVKSEEKKQELYDKACNQQKVLDASVVLVVLGDREGYKRQNPIWEEKLRLDKITEEKIDNVISYSDKNLYDTKGKKISYAVRNSSLLAMSTMYAAEYYGVNTHPMIGFDQEELKKIFDIEDNMETTMLITLGYFDQSKELNERETRFDYDQIVEEV
ncbi:MAG: nitroreductase family protein [Halanaerobiales bacterium]